MKDNTDMVVVISAMDITDIIIQTIFTEDILTILLTLIILIKHFIKNLYSFYFS